MRAIVDFPAPWGAMIARIGWGASGRKADSINVFMYALMRSLSGRNTSMSLMRPAGSGDGNDRASLARTNRTGRTSAGTIFQPPALISTTVHSSFVRSR